MNSFILITSESPYETAPYELPYETAPYELPYEWITLCGGIPYD